jgi:hypothetical protein
MVAKCANPACNVEFRELSKGRLFLLPPTREAYCEALGRVERLSDYCYWLCPECDATYTITRGESEVVVALRGPGVPYAMPVSVASPRRKRPGQIALRSCAQAG